MGLVLTSLHKCFDYMTLLCWLLLLGQLRFGKSCPFIPIDIWHCMISSLKHSSSKPKFPLLHVFWGKKLTYLIRKMNSILVCPQQRCTERDICSGQQCGNQVMPSYSMPAVFVSCRRTSNGTFLTYASSFAGVAPPRRNLLGLDWEWMGSWNKVGGPAAMIHPPCKSALIFLSPTEPLMANLSIAGGVQSSNPCTGKAHHRLGE